MILRSTVFTLFLLAGAMCAGDTDNVLDPVMARFAFVREVDGAKAIWISRMDGADARQLTRGGRICVEPKWSGDGRFLVYTRYVRRATDIILLDVVNKRHRRLAGFCGLNAGAALNGDGSRAAMILSKDGSVDLYVMELKDRTLKRLTRSPDVEASPCWSPDGRRICFVSDKGVANPTLFVIDAKGGTARRVLKTRAEAVSPDWSPVSNRIAFSTRRGKQYVLAVLDMNEKGARPRIVVKDDGDWESPSWTADGRHLVCSRASGDTLRLALVDTEKGTWRLLGDAGSRDSMPACIRAPEVK